MWHLSIALSNGCDSTTEHQFIMSSLFALLSPLSNTSNYHSLSLGLATVFKEKTTRSILSLFVKNSERGKIHATPIFKNKRKYFRNATSGFDCIISSFHIRPSRDHHLSSFFNCVLIDHHWTIIIFGRSRFKYNNTRRA